MERSLHRGRARATDQLSTGRSGSEPSQPSAPPLTIPKGEADLEAFESAERDALEQAAVDLRGLWQGLSRTEQGLATALARGEAPFSRTRSDAGNRGEGARAALNSLTNRGEVVRDGKQYHLVDPFFAELLRRSWQP